MLSFILQLRLLLVKIFFVCRRRRGYETIKTAQISASEINRRKDRINQDERKKKALNGCDAFVKEFSIYKFSFYSPFFQSHVFFYSLLLKAKRIYMRWWKNGKR